MSAGSTPGPWVVLNEEEGSSYVRVRGTRLGARFKIANVLFAAPCEEEIAEARANAQLIAEAPEIHSAAKRVLGLIDYLQEFKGLQDHIAVTALRKALAKVDAKLPVEGEIG